MITTFDQDTDAVYIRVGSGKITTTTVVSENLIIDIDANGNTVGIEILNASAQGLIIEDTERGAAISSLPV